MPDVREPESARGEHMARPTPAEKNGVQSQYTDCGVNRH